ncbi:MAG TPA: type VI secretion system baseplate subunit TssK [Rhabdochlamydiaceae bacterium]|nr:type VI secretion system baseplate subunit TssK [Rhabdochlamydiaceae bacterium]
MQQLKRVSWQIGQPLLPRHLVSQEDSLLAHTSLYFKHIGLPFYGIGCLKWDDTLMSQGIISMTKLTVIFPSGLLIDVPANGTINSLDLNKMGKTELAVYLHLLSTTNEEEEYLDSGTEYDKIVYVVNQLELSVESNAHSVKSVMKLAEFEKDLENRWSLRPDYIPPLLTVYETPFLLKPMIELKTRLEQFQSSLELESTTGHSFEGHTLETKLCLLEIAKMRRLIINLEQQVAAHPYFLYQAFSEYLDAVAILYNDKTNFKMLPYQHEKLGPLFVKLMEALKVDDMGDHNISRLQFEKRDHCYVSEKLPQELQDAREVYLILQKVESLGNPNIEGVKLAAYSRLMNTIIFGVQGISLIRLERVPFNHNFSKRANIYTVERDLEWGHALKEGRLAFNYKDDVKDLQAFLYWR